MPVAWRLLLLARASCAKARGNPVCAQAKRGLTVQVPPRHESRKDTMEDIDGRVGKGKTDGHLGRKGKIDGHFGCKPLTRAKQI